MNTKLTQAEAERLTPEEFEKLLMSEHYDLREAYDTEVAPLMRQVHEACAKHGIPMLASFCVSNDGVRIGCYTSANFDGPERTPTSFAAANRVLRELDQHQALAVMQQIDFFNQIQSMAATHN